MFRHRLNIVFYLLLISTVGQAVEKTNGLLFSSSEEKVDNRTSLLFFDDKPLKIQDSLRLSFDISIWDFQRFGHIFRMIDERKKEVEFVFVNFYGDNQMYLDFHSPITHKSVQIPISKESIENKELLHIDFLFNLEQDKTIITIGDDQYICTPIGLENPSAIMLAFGLYGLNLDVPQMLLKNICIDTFKDKILKFPLGESSGNKVYAIKSREKATVRNPNWMINKHFYWQTKASFSVDKQVFVTYDPSLNQLLITNGDSLLFYNLRNDVFSQRHALHPPQNFRINDVLFDARTDTLMLFGSEPFSLFQRELIPNNFPITYISTDEATDALHHNSFLSQTSDVFIFGGYSNYTYSNSISKINLESLTHEELNFSGDPILPRLYSACAVSGDDVYIFGGFGNETGKQEHVGRNLYDLYKLNLESQKITKLWELPEAPKFEFIPGKDLVLDHDENKFYAFCYAHYKSNTIGYLCRFDIDSGSYEFVSDSVSLKSEGMSSSVHLFFNALLQEFYVVIIELNENNHSDIKIYGLQSPPITQAYLSKVDARPKYSFMVGVAVTGLLLLVVLVIGAFLYLRRKKRSKAVSFEDVISLVADSEIFDTYSQKHSSVYIFGNFTAFDKSGNDISYRFSSKLRSLFTLILLNSGYKTGITTEKLTSGLWPDKELSEAKNIRGVTINRFRSVLADLEGITLQHQNSQWFFEFEKNFYLDYFEYRLLINELSNPDTVVSEELLDKLYKILSKGTFLQSLQEQVFDTFKSTIEAELIELLKGQIDALYKRKYYHKVVQFASVYNMIDPTDKFVFDLCVKAYNKLDKKQESAIFINQYKKIYKNITGTDLLI
ncbi:MAG TPA: kelch repeat-containing protein [Paludibacter sp.]|nr:MAG: Kelch motif protein [Bacteroidetes bacterium ADurb.Bin174]HQB27635.1 kelch repeat-containing protein [Paludibacter sp.]